MSEHDTIIALSSGSLPSGVAILRVSGADAFAFTHALCGRKLSPRQAHLCKIKDPETGALIDQGLVIAFPGPHSFTGEDCCEFQVHGSQAVVRRLISLATDDFNIRLAEAGEFSRRAMENGQLDLTQVEGLGDLLAAETEHQRALAMSRFDGKMRAEVSAWRELLIGHLARIEAELDFSDEDDVDVIQTRGLRDDLEYLRESWKRALTDFKRNRRLREGVRIVMVGPPNVGKSSVINKLSNSDLAIVSAEAGTTRDVREVRLDLDGVLAILVDVAGLRESDSVAEQEGVRRALKEIDDADICLHLQSLDVKYQSEFDFPAGARVLRINSKSDLGALEDLEYAVSSETGQGFGDLLEGLSEVAKNLAIGEQGLVSHLRDQQSLNASLDILRRLQSFIDRSESSHIDLDWELVVEDLRQIVFLLDRIVGHVDVEDVLDRLFSGFCIGK